MKSTAETLAASVLIAGRASGPALVLDEALSFWGGFDPANGEIIDVHHPQRGCRVGGSILFIPESRGSAGTPGGIAETLRNGSGPLAFVLGERDVNIGVGVLVANRLYGLEVPVLEIDRSRMQDIQNGALITIDHAGELAIGSSA